MKTLLLLLMLTSTTLFAQKEIRYEGKCYFTLVDSSKSTLDSCFSTCGKFIVTTTRIEHIEAKSVIYEIQQREWISSCSCLYYSVYPEGDEYQQFVIRIDERMGIINVGGFVDKNFVIVDYRIKIQP